MLEMALNLLDNVINTELNSKISGNKNWFIHINSKWNYAEVGRPGHASPLTFSCYLNDIQNHHWYYFTKKKDFEEALAKVEATGIRILWC